MSYLAWVAYVGKGVEVKEKYFDLDTLLYHIEYVIYKKSVLRKYFVKKRTYLGNWNAFKPFLKPDVGQMLSNSLYLLQSCKKPTRIGTIAFIN